MNACCSGCNTPRAARPSMVVTWAACCAQPVEIASVREPARATMLSALLDGRALTASELAYAARVAPHTATTHLAKLTAARLLSPTRDGRHRYSALHHQKWW